VTVNRGPGRDGSDWRRVRALVLDGATLCSLCGGELDLTAPPRSPQAPSVDHVIPLAELQRYDPETRRRMALDPALLRPAHYGCNSRRGAGRRPTARRTSQQW